MHIPGRPKAFLKQATCEDNGKKTWLRPCWSITENTEGHVELFTMEDRHRQHLTHFTFKNTIKRKTAKGKKGRKKTRRHTF